ADRRGTGCRFSYRPENLCDRESRSVLRRERAFARHRRRTQRRAGRGLGGLQAALQPRHRALHRGSVGECSGLSGASRGRGHTTSFKTGESPMSYLVPSEFVTKMVDDGEAKIFMSTRDTLIRAYMAG